jgi:hypothetical protein
MEQDSALLLSALAVLLGRSGGELAYTQKRDRASR